MLHFKSGCDVPAIRIEPEHVNQTHRIASRRRCERLRQRVNAAVPKSAVAAQPPAIIRSNVNMKAER